MTSIESQILSILKSNGRMSASDIGKMVGKSASDIEAIIEELTATGIIKQFTCVIDENQFSEDEKTVKALIEVCITPEKASGFTATAQKIAQFPNVIEHYLVSGSYDFLVIVEGKTIQEISAFVYENLAPIENVRSTVTHFLMHKYKSNGVIINDFLKSRRMPVSP